MSRYRDVVAFCLLACLWGLNYPAVEVGFSWFPPLLMMAIRYGIAGVLLLGYVVWRSHQWRPATSGDVTAIVGGGIFWITIGNGIWFIGQDLTTSVLSALMTGLAPIATTAIAWVLLPDERLTSFSLVGLLVSFAGAILMFWPTGGFTVDSALLGKGLLLVGVVGLGIGSVLIRWASVTISSPSQTAWSVLVGAVVIYLLSVITGEGRIGTIPVEGMVILFYTSVPATVVAYVIFFWLLEHYPAVEITLVTYIVPIIAAASGWALLGDPLTRRMIIGFFVVLIGFGLLKGHVLYEELTGPTIKG
jgi:drug/metabolite transporter (DMT)-like permease